LKSKGKIIEKGKINEKAQMMTKGAVIISPPPFKRCDTLTRTFRHCDS
jgi:hypothetical protein